MFQPQESIGLLGGSFNPAHAGHLHLSVEALKRLKLDKVVWLVSPQNPLKSTQDMAPYATRFAYARKLTQGVPDIIVSDYEAQHGYYYSYDTIVSLQRSYPKVHFVWLMGADNLASLHRWHQWRGIMEHIPIAIFDRAPFCHAALRQKAALAYARARLPERAAAQLARSTAPAWIYGFMPRHPQSATHLRKMLGADAFL